MFKYTIKRQLKQLPGNVTVFSAVQKDLDRAVEIRVLNHFVRTDSDEYLRFEREFKTIARLDHPNIIKVFDWGIANDKIYYVAEMKSAHAFDDLAATGEIKFTVPEALDVGRQIASAVAYLHKHNIVHRDLTFSSINYQKEKRVAYIAHFSLVKNLNLEDLTARGVGHFQSLQMTPERLLGMEVDQRTDVFLFGAFLYQLIAGTNPLDGGDKAQLVTADTFDFTPPSKLRADVPAAIDAIILKCLKKQPEERFQTAADLVKDLEQAVEDCRVRSKREATARMRAIDEPITAPPEADSADDDADTGSGEKSTGGRSRRRAGPRVLKSGVAIAAVPVAKGNDVEALLEKIKATDPRILAGVAAGAAVLVVVMLIALIL